MTPIVLEFCVWAGCAASAVARELLGRAVCVWADEQLAAGLLQTRCGHEAAATITGLTSLARRYLRNAIERAASTNIRSSRDSRFFSHTGCGIFRMLGSWKKQ